MKKIIYIVFAVFMVACSSSTKDKKYNEASYQKDLQAMQDAHEMDSSDAVLLIAYVERAKRDGIALEGKTYSQLLAEAKALPAETIDGVAVTADSNTVTDSQGISLSEKEGSAYSAKMARMKDVMEVSFKKKELIDKGDKKYMSFKFEIKNKSDKTIKSATGDFIFSDVMGKQVKVVGITYDGDVIQPNSAVKFASSVDYDDLDVNDITLKNAPTNELSMEWSPREIIYADGTAVE